MTKRDIIILVLVGRAPLYVSWSFDNETIAPMLEGAVRLLMLTRDREYLKIAEDAAYYLAAWQFAQSIPNVPGSLMDAVGYDTFGGTSVATVHMCADPYALS